MCEADAISIEELKRQRAEIRDEIARLRAANVEEPRGERPMTLEAFARLVIKGAMRFGRVGDRREQKAILEQLLAEVFFRSNSITAFGFHPSIVASLGDAEKELWQTITLGVPFRIAQEIPAGLKQCSKCRAVLPETEFPKAVSLCNPCYRAQTRARWERWRQKNDTAE
jgi:hypothetical protein